MLSNNQIKLINQLKQKKIRQQYNLFIAEGVKTVNEFLKSLWLPSINLTLTSSPLTTSLLIGIFLGIASSLGSIFYVKKIRAHSLSNIIEQSGLEGQFSEKTLKA